MPPLLLAAIIAAGTVNRPVQNMYSAPTEDSDVVSQAIYGANVKIEKESKDWLEVRTADDYKGWMPATALVRNGKPYATTGRIAMVTNLYSHLYREASVTKHAPVITVPFETKVEIMGEAEGHWLRVRLVDDRSAFIQKGDLSFDELMPDCPEIESLGSEGSINPETFAIRSEEAGLLRGAIQKLPAQNRIVLVLRDMEGLTDEDVAEITGLRAGTVRVRLHRARLFVRKELTKSRRPGIRKSVKPAPSQARVVRQPRPPRCKAMFAELSNYLDEKLDDSLCEELEKHLVACGPCQAFLASLEATIKDCRQLPSPMPDRAKAAKLRKDVVLRCERAIAEANG